jgi:hypothetical protein
MPHVKSAPKLPAKPPCRARHSARGSWSGLGFWLTYGATCSQPPDLPRGMRSSEGQLATDTQSTEANCLHRLLLSGPARKLRITKSKRMRFLPCVQATNNQPAPCQVSNLTNNGLRKESPRIGMDRVCSDLDQMVADHAIPMLTPQLMPRSLRCQSTLYSVARSPQGGRLSPKLTFLGTF